MTSNLFFLELRLLTRELSVWVLLTLFAAALVYGLWNGMRIADSTGEVADTLAKSEETFDAQLRENLGKRELDPKRIATRGSVAVLPPAALPVLSAGQSDLSPGYENVVLWRLDSPADTRSELENPSHLLAGRFDLAFVLIWLYPLFLLALVYDLMAGDRESGTLRMALAQGITPWRWMARRALVRALPVLLLALLATLVASFLRSSGDVGSRVTLALAIVLAYGVFWITLSVAVNAVARSAASAATALGASWVFLVLVVPTLLNVGIETLYPTPSRPELVAEGRRASNEAEKQGGELLNSFYRDHPELAPAGQRGDFYAQRLTVQSEVQRSVEPVRQRFDEQLTQQQTAVSRWRFASPAIAAYEALTDLAGTGFWRHRSFRTQVLAFKETVADFYSPKVHRRESLTLSDYDHMPRFVFREEPTNALIGRVGAGLAGILALAAMLFAWALWYLRPTRLGQMTT